MKKQIKDIWLPIKALVIKEMLAVLRDKKSRITLVVPPLVQLIVLVHAATLDVNNISIGIFNQDNGWYSQELVQRIKGSPYFLHAYEYKTPTPGVPDMLKIAYIKPFTFNGVNYFIGATYQTLE